MRCQSSQKQYKSATVPRVEKKRVAGVDVTLSWPSKDASASPKGVAFLLPGAFISITEYDGLRDVIIEQQHLVVSLYVNVFWPLSNNHRKHARDVKRVFDELTSMYTNLPISYNIVGHSVGGKIALLVASIIDPKRVSGVLSLDPVDLNPIEFSNEKGPNLPLEDCIGNSKYGSIGPLVICSDDEHTDFVHVVNGIEQKDAKDGSEEQHIPIILTCTDGGRGIPKTHDAEAIHKLHPATICYRHAHAGHLAYCDNGGGLPGKLIPDVGTKEGNEKAREAAHDLIRRILGS